MKVITILLASLSLSTSAFSQKLVKDYWDSGKTKLQAEYYEDANGKSNSTYKCYFYEGGLYMNGQLKNNYPIGKWTEYYPDGKIHYIKIHTSTGNFNTGVINGKIISYYENGKTIRYEKNLKDGDPVGEYKEYDVNGTLTTEGNYVNGVLERIGESKRIYDEEQAFKENETLRIKKDEYNKIISEADKAFEFKEYKKALELYQLASSQLENEKYPIDKISEMIEKFNTSSVFISDYSKNQYDTLNNDFKTLKSDFKVKTILSEYNTVKYIMDVWCDCKQPWNEKNPRDCSKNCFRVNKGFYEPYQIAITEAFFKYEDALELEKENASKLYIRFAFKGTEYLFTTYDKTTFLNNLKVAKENFELSKSLKINYLKAIENKVSITNLNKQNKKKTLLKKYFIVYENLFTKINAYAGLAETHSFLQALNSVSDKVVALYSQDTEVIEKKLKEAETSEQIQTIILGQ